MEKGSEKPVPDSSGRILERKPRHAGQPPDIEPPAFKRKVEPARLLFNQLGLFLRFIRPEAMIDVGHNQEKVELLANKMQQVKEDHGIHPAGDTHHDPVSLVQEAVAANGLSSRP